MLATCAASTQTIYPNSVNLSRIFGELCSQCSHRRPTVAPPLSTRSGERGYTKVIMSTEFRSPHEPQTLAEDFIFFGPVRDSSGPRRIRHGLTLARRPWKKPPRELHRPATNEASSDSFFDRE